MTRTAKTYGGALFDLAEEEGRSRQILEEMTALDAAFRAEPDYLYLLATPSLSKEERCGILDESFRDRIHPYVLNFLKILTEKGYIRYFSDCCRAYREQYNEDNDILCVRAVAAQPLTTEQLQNLTRKLVSVTGKKIQLECDVDPACMGGIRLDYDGKRVDGTVQNRLASIGKLLKNTML